MSPVSEGQSEPLGVAEEVSRLADAVQAWWASAHVPDPEPREARRAAGASHAGDAGQPEPDEQREHEHSCDERVSSCQICPVCRALDLLRAVRPEVLQQVANAAETVAILLREAAGDRERHAADQPPPPRGEQGPEDVAATGGDGGLPDPFTRGTPIVVTDGGGPASQVHDVQEDEGGRTAWA